MSIGELMQLQNICITTLFRNSAHHVETQFEQNVDRISNKKTPLEKWRFLCILSFDLHK
jgi:hypothetical protein